MSFSFYNLVQIDSLYITSNEDADGIKYIAEVHGTDAFESEVAQDIRALSGTVYTQVAQDAGEVIDAPIDIHFPLLEVSMKDAIKTVLQAYTGTPFTCVITGDPGTFTGTAKPANTPRPIEYPGTFQNGKLKDVTVHLYLTLS